LGDDDLEQGVAEQLAGHCDRDGPDAGDLADLVPLGVAVAQRGRVEPQQDRRRRWPTRAVGTAREGTLGDGDERVGRVRLEGLPASLGPGFGEYSLLFGAQRGADPGPGIGSELPLAAVGALGVSPAAHIARRVDPPVARELVVATRGVGLHACRVLLQPGELIGTRPIQQVTLGMGRLRRGCGDLANLRLGEPPRPELLFGPGQLGESTRRLHHPHRLADTGPARCGNKCAAERCPSLTQIRASSIRLINSAFAATLSRSISTNVSSSSTASRASMRSGSKSCTTRRNPAASLDATLRDTETASSTGNSRPTGGSGTVIQAPGYDTQSSTLRFGPRRVAVTLHPRTALGGELVVPCTPNPRTGG